MRPIDGDALKIMLDTFATIVGFSGVYDRGQVMECIDAAPTVATDTNVLGKWISVKDRLPEQAGCRCLVSAEYGDGKRTVFTAFTGYGEPGWWTYDVIHMERAMYADNHVHHNYHITHWMPMPEPPEEGDGE